MVTPRLGQILLEEGVIANEDLRRALCYQRVQMKSRQQKLLGEILVEFGVISPCQLLEALNRQTTKAIISRKFLIPGVKVYKSNVKILSLSINNLTRSELLEEFTEGICFTRVS